MCLGIQAGGILTSILNARQSSCPRASSQRAVLVMRMCGEDSGKMEDWFWTCPNWKDGGIWSETVFKMRV